MCAHRNANRPFKVVVPALHPRFENAALLLAGKGCRIERLPPGTPGMTKWTPELMAAHLADADALVGTFPEYPITREVIAAAPRLRVITSTIIGTENFDVEAATDLGIVVAHGATPENTLGVAEAVVMLVAAWRKRLVPKLDAVRSGGWRVPDAGHLVRGATVGLIGFGRIGQATAKRLAGWECRLLAFDPYVDAAVAREHGVELITLDELLARSDVVSIMVTLTSETRYLIGARELTLMKPDAFLINTARGGCVDEAALLEALDGGRLAGAALDTWEDERPQGSSPLRKHPKVIGTAHNVGHSEELYDGLGPMAAQNTWLALNGETPTYVKNPEVLTRWRERLKKLAAE